MTGYRAQVTEGFAFRAVGNLLPVAFVVKEIAIVLIRALDGHEVFFAQPAAKVDTAATIAAEGQRGRLAAVELFAADRTANERHGC